MGKLKELVMAVEDAVADKSYEHAGDISFQILDLKGDMKDEMEDEAADILSDYDMTLDAFIEMYGEEQWHEYLEEQALSALAENGISV